MHRRQLQLPVRIAVMTAALLCAGPGFAARSPEVTMRLNNMMHQVDRQLLQMRLATQQFLEVSGGVAREMGDEEISEDNGKSTLTVPEEQSVAMVQAARHVASNGETVLLMLRDIDAETQRVLLDLRSQSMRLVAAAEQIRSARHVRAEYAALEQMRRAIEATEGLSRRYWQISPLGGR